MGNTKNIDGDTVSFKYNITEEIDVVEIESNQSSISLTTSESLSVSVTGDSNSIDIRLSESIKREENAPSCDITLFGASNTVYVHPQIDYSVSHKEGGERCTVKEIRNPSHTADNSSEGATGLIRKSKNSAVKETGWFGKHEIKYQKEVESEYCKSCGSDAETIVKNVSETRIIFFGLSLRKKTIAEYEECPNCAKEHTADDLSRSERKDIFS